MFDNKFNNRIAIAYGDGIGPEIMEVVLRLMQEAEVNLSIDVIEIGEKQYNHGIPSGIPLSALETIKNNRILLKAPITTPRGGGYKSVNVTLRNNLNLYSNVRPVKSYTPFVACNFPKMDLALIRENQEGLYSGIEYRQTIDMHKSLKIVTQTGSEKIIKYAFDYAMRHNRKKVTCFIKDNIMKITDGMFHDMFKKIASFYPEIENSQMLVDIGMAKVAADPEAFDVIVTQNLYGDILSDIAAEVSGSVGLCGSANIGEKYAMFEAIHGSAPDIAGKNIANPSGLINAAVMMLRHIGMNDKAALIENALHVTLEQGNHTADLYNEKNSNKKLGTEDFGSAVIKNLGAIPKTFNVAQEKKTSNSYKLRNIKLTKKFPIEKRKVLVGVDVFIDNEKNYKIKKIVTLLKKATAELTVDIQAITVGGIIIWPCNEKKLQDIPKLYSCRFVSKNQRNKKISPIDIINLLKELQAHKLNFISSENLYVFDGKIGFSLVEEIN